MTAWPVVLSFQPTSRGFGWTLFEGPSAPLDWGLAYAKGDRTETCVRQLTTLLERHRPEYLVLEDLNGRRRQASPYISELRRRAVETAEQLGVEVRRYTRRDVARAVTGNSDATRHEVAEAIAKHIQAFAYRLPPQRKPWESVDRRLALFSAAGLAFALYAEE